jgi:hypothetical protein
MKQYLRWQNLHTTLRPKELGFLPTADEYEDFQQWLKKQDSGYFSDVFEDVVEHIKPASADEPPTAILCRHTMHPVTAGQLRRRCPVCTIDMYISYTRALEKALRNAGGRAPKCVMTAASPLQEGLYAAFVTAKLQALCYLEEFERLAEEEAKWSAQHPEWSNEDARTADRALALYWSENGGLMKSETKSPKKAKAVSFAPDTEFDERRPQDYYRRNSLRYEPGRYTLEEQDEEEDIVSEDSEDYSRAPILLEQGPGETNVNVVNFYDFTQTIGVLSDVIRWNEAGIRKAESPLIGPEEMSRLELLDDEDDDDEDDESDWDMEDGETDGSDYIYFEAEEDCSFVVFGED